MINIIIGGSLSGKTTFVRKRLGGKFKECKLEGVPISRAGRVCAVGFYSKKIRTCGLDQMGRNYPQIWGRLFDFICVHYHNFDTIYIEGNAAADKKFIDGLEGFKIKITLLDPHWKVVADRCKALNIKYGKSILMLSYRRAFKIYEGYKGVHDHEIIG